MIPIPLITAALSAVITVVVILLTALKRSSNTAIPQWRWILAVSLAIIVGHIGWISGVEFTAAAEEATVGDILQSTFDAVLHPKEAAHWIVLLLAGLGVAALMLTPLKSNHPAAFLLQSLVWWALLASALTRLLWGSVHLTRQWSTTESLFHIGTESLLLTIAIVPGLRRLPANAAPGQLLLWTFVGICSGIVIGLSGSAVYAQMTMVTCLVPAICIGFAWWTRASEYPQCLPAGLIIAAIGFHLWLAHYFAELTLLNEVLLMGALIAASWFGLLSHQQLSYQQLRTIRILRGLAIACTVLLSGTVLALAGKAFSDALAANPYY